MLFGKRNKHVLDDPEFGRIVEEKPGSWHGNGFHLWGYSSLQVIIDAGAEGPSPEQRAFLQNLRLDRAGIRAQIEQAVLQHAKETTPQAGPLKLSSIYFPKTSSEQMWRVWYDMEGEDHYWYGAEIQGWDHIVPFTED